MGEIRNARRLLLQRQWNQYADQQVDPIRRSLTGSITPIMNWIHYADHELDPICRSSSGSYRPIADTVHSNLAVITTPSAQIDLLEKRLQ